MEYDSIIIKYSSRTGVDPNLIRAIIQTESAGCQWVSRFEPGWRYFFKVRDYADKLMITYDTEYMFQATSHGLMQVMGSVFRELDFDDYLIKTYDPEINIQYGALKLKQLMWKYGNEDDIISAYNQGSPIKEISGLYRNEKYVDKVSGYLRQLRPLK